MGAQARQNRRSNEILQLHGKITHQEKLRDARGTNKPTKTKSIYKQAKPTDRQQTGSIHSISEMFFTFLTRKNKLEEKAGILARKSHTSVASDWTYHFSHM